MEDLEMLISAVERMQVKFKNGINELEKISDDIKKFSDKKAMNKNDESVSAILNLLDELI